MPDRAWCVEQMRNVYLKKEAMVDETMGKERKKKEDTRERRGGLKTRRTDDQGTLAYGLIRAVDGWRLLTKVARKYHTTIRL